MVFGRLKWQIRAGSTAIVVGAIALTVSAVAASACDELVSRLIANAIRPSIESLDCSGLDKAGLNNAEHHLASVCYTSTGSQSNIVMVVDLKCRTSDAAFIQASVSEQVTASATVQASGCQILDLSVEASGDIGRILLGAFDASGAARKALQEVLDKAC